MRHTEFLESWGDKVLNFWLSLFVRCLNKHKCEKYKVHLIKYLHSSHVDCDIRNGESYAELNQYLEFSIVTLMKFIWKKKMNFLAAVFNFLAAVFNFDP